MPRPTLRRDRKGTALIEVAFGLPVLLVLLMTGAELANYAIVHLRMSQVANMAASNVARIRDRIDEKDINDIIIGLKLEAGQLNLTTTGRVIISTVEDNGATTASTVDNIVTWQRCKGKYVPTNPAPYTVEGQVLTAGVGPTGGAIYAKPGNALVFVEVFYSYKPMVGMFQPFVGNQLIRYATAHSVRDRSYQALQNGSNLSATDKATCDKFTV